MKHTLPCTSTQTRCSRPGAATLGLGLILLAAPVFATSAFAAETRTFTANFPADSKVRLANLAGRVTLTPGAGPDITVTVTAHGDLGNATKTKKVLADLAFVEATDRDGRRELALSYPVDDYDTFHYPRLSGRNREPGFWESLFAGMSQTTTSYRGERIRVTGGSGSPMLYADLAIALPANANLVIRNVVGDVEGGNMSGKLRVDTGSGEVTIDAFDGELEVDTGSGDVTIDLAVGSVLVDTGSGGIDLGELRGSGILDTGSGSVTVGRVDGDRLQIDTGSGSIEVRDGRVGTLLADTGSGSIEVRRVELERFVGDTGSGSVTLESSLIGTREVTIDTGSGSVTILGGPDASFDLLADQGSGDLDVGYRDAKLIREGREVIGATRGDGATRIRVDTGSGGCEISPAR